MTDYKTKYEEVERKVAGILGVDKGSPCERVYMISTIAQQDDALKELERRLNIETEVHKRVEEALAKAYIKGT
jgi:hypothetical protein